jgi:hypothetical protein
MKTVYDMVEGHIEERILDARGRLVHWRVMTWTSPAAYVAWLRDHLLVNMVTHRLRVHASPKAVVRRTGPWHYLRDHDVGGLFVLLDQWVRECDARGIRF